MNRYNPLFPDKRPRLLQLRSDVITAEAALQQALLDECRRLFAQQAPPENELDIFFAALHGIAPKLRGAVGYELARMGLSTGRSGFHGLHHGGMTDVPLPFQFFGWAGFQPWGGIAFQVHRDCFASDTPLLFFEADGRPYEPKERYGADTESVERAIRSYSAEITEITAKTEIGHCRSRCRITFRLKPRGNKPLIGLELQDQLIPAALFHDPVIQIPIVGEFNCTFGEVTPEGDVPLHRDDFCMK